MQTAQKLSITLTPSAVAFIETYRKRHKAASRSQVISEALRALEQRERESSLEAAYSASAQEDIAINAEFDAVALDGLDSRDNQAKGIVAESQDAARYSRNAIKHIKFSLLPAGFGILLALLMGATNNAIAQAYPTKPVRMIVATTPGSGDDYTTRLIAPKLGELLGQQFVVENRAGAGGMIGQTFVAKAAPDGYTLLLAGGSMAGARYVNASITYDVLKDFSPISLLETAQFILVVHPSVPVRNAKEYVALLRATPGKMTFGTIGPGQIPYWAALMFNNMARVQAVEVAYKGYAELTIDLMAGRLDYLFAPASLAAANRVKLRALASTGAKRMPAFPELPNMAAALPGYDMPAWRSIMGPAGMRRDIVDTLNNALVRSVASSDVREKMINAGSEPESSTPDALIKRYIEWNDIFGKVAKQAGIKPM